MAQAELEQAKTEFQIAEKNYGRGMIGAILGTLIGAIPWLLLEIFWGYAAVLSLLIGFAAYYGYKIFGGLVTKATKWLMLFPILIAVIISHFVSITIQMVSYDIPLIIENYIIIYSDSLIGPELFRALLLGIFFSLLGYISIFRHISSEEFKTEIQ